MNDLWMAKLFASVSKTATCDRTDCNARKNQIILPECWQWKISSQPQVFFFQLNRCSVHI